MPDPKTPQDHKQKTVEKPDGWDLLKPFDQIPAWDQANIIAALAPLPATVSFSDPAAVRALGDLARALVPCAVSGQAIVEFLSGKDGLANAATLGSWLAGQLGE